LNEVELINSMISILDEKKVMLEKMLDLTNKQTSVISVNDLIALGGIIEEKQSLIERIDKIDEVFNKNFEKLKVLLNIKNLEEIGDDKLPELKKLQAAVKGIIDIVDHITYVEDYNNKKTKEILKDISKKLDTISKGKKAYNAYEKKDKKSPSYFIDKKK